MSSTDPLSRLYTAFVEELKANPDLTALVDVANIIRFDTDNERPELDLRTDSDLPEICIDFAAISRGTGNSSSSFGVSLTLTILVQSETQICNDPRGLCAVAWQVFLSAQRLRNAAAIPGIKQVHSIDFGPGTVGFGDARGLGRQPEGYFCVTQIVFDMSFQKSEYLPA
jgi:hypothetical protein